MNRQMIGVVCLMLGWVIGGCQEESDPLKVNSRARDQVQPSDLPERYTVTLITGDRLEVSKGTNGSWVVVVDQAPRPTGQVAFTRFRDQKTGTFVIPADVKHLVPRVLDAQFFNIDYLIENKMDDAHQNVVSAIVTVEDSSALQRTATGAALQYRRLPAATGMGTITMAKNQLRGRTGVLWQAAGQRSGLAIGGVKKIRPNRVFQAVLDQAVPAVGGDVAHQTHGLYGQGVNVAVLDTGVDSTHPDFFFEDGTSKLAVDENMTCFTTDDPWICEDTPLDLDGHGTHVSSTAVGTGAASDGLYQRVAPEAWLMNVKVLNSNGFGLESDIIQGIFVAALGTNGVRGDEPEIEADIISMSLGGPMVVDVEDPVITAVNQVVNEYGVIVVAAAGNDYDAFTIASPGGAEGALTVGASSKTEPFSVAGFSSRGPTLGTFSLKPDLVAPGEEIVAACSGSSNYFQCDPQVPYLAFSGTSMATPVVAGGAALMVEQARAAGRVLSPQSLKDRLLSTSESVSATWEPDQPASVFAQGAGRMKLDRALTVGLVFSPARLSPGMFPHDVAGWHRSVQLTNDTDQTKMIDLTVTLSSDGESYDETVTLTPSQVSLAPGESAEVLVEADLQGLPEPRMWQMFDGRIIASENEQPIAQSIFGFTREGELFLLDIQTIGLDGDPVLWPNLFIYEAEQPDGPYFYPWDHYPDADGHLRLQVPSGIYNLSMELFEFADEIDAHFRIMHFELEVDEAAASVVLDARLAEPVVLDFAADPLATATKEFNTTWQYVWPDHGNITSFGSSAFGQLYVHSNKAPTIGSFGVINHWVLGREPLDQSEVLYNWVETRDRDEAYELRVSEADLLEAGVADVHYHSEWSGVGSSAGWVCPTDAINFPYYCDFIMAWVYPQPMPKVFRQYYTPLVGAYGGVFEPLEMELHLWDNEFTVVDDVFLWGKVWQPGEGQTVRWGHRPMKPAYGEVERIDNTLTLRGYSFEDPYGHVSTDYIGWPDGLGLKVSVNGEQTAQFDDIYSVEVDVPAEPAIVGLTLDSRSSPALTDYPVETSSSISFITTGDDQAALPIPNTRYEVEGINEFNRVECQGNDTCQLKFSVNIESTVETDAPLAFFGWIWLSTHDGQSWFSPERVYKYGSALKVDASLTLADEDPTAVSVKLFAFTSDGMLITETVKRAFLLERSDSSATPL